MSFQIFYDLSAFDGLLTFHDLSIFYGLSTFHEFSIVYDLSTFHDLSTFFQNLFKKSWLAAKRLINLEWPNICSLISAESADLSHNQKKIIFLKKCIFLNKKSALEGAKLTQ